VERQRHQRHRALAEPGVELGAAGSGEPSAKDGADQNSVRDLRHLTHKTIKRVTDDLEKFRYNTMLALLMEMTNCLGKVQADRSADAASWQKPSTLCFSCWRR